MKEYLEKISSFGSGERAHQRVREIASFHRIQCSTGLRQAAHHCQQVLESQGICARVISYPFDEKHWYWGQRSFLEWDCKGGWLDLLTEKGRQRLADFDTCATSVMQKSGPCDYSSQPLDIVLMDKGSRKEDYEGVDLQGKLLFLREPFAAYMDWAFTEKGAVGFVTDYLREVPGVRSREDLYDIRNYTSFWWKDWEKEPHIFGFVLTPRQGDALAKLCREMREEGKYPQALCKMDTRLYPGELEVVEAFLPGETEEEVLVLAHLCHPRPSANDNASGCAVAMELLRTLHELLERGELPPLRRGIRVCLVPEFSGTYPYLCQREGELSRIVGAINLDMVGGRQSRGYGPLTLSDQPWSSSPLVTALSDVVLRQVKSQCEVLKQGNMAPLFNSHIGPFVPGSDHMILSDPLVGIPCPMLGQWPDLYYHTSGDTPEQVDPQMLHNSLCIAAGFAYSLANFGEEEAGRTLWRLKGRHGEEMERLGDACLMGEDKTTLGEKARAITQFYVRGCEDTIRLCSAVKEAGLHAEESLRRAMEETLEALGNPPLPEKKAGKVPQRTLKGPIIHLEDMPREDEEKKQAYKAYEEQYRKGCPDAMLFETLLLFAMDGERTLEECVRLAQLEAGVGSQEMAEAFLKILDINLK